LILMKRFVIVGHKAVTAKFSLNDMPGAAGRMDIMARCMNAALFLSHDMRRDVEVFSVLLGEPCPPLVVRFNGQQLRYLSPDERSAGSLIRKALEKGAPATGEEESTPGVFISKRSFEELMGGMENIVYLHEAGEDIRSAELTGNETFVLSDHHDLTPEEEAVLEKKGAKKVSLGKMVYHADHCIVIVNNELDRRAEKAEPA
jgi:tRNA (pseudouridine54-N1)-methyltransferase